MTLSQNTFLIVVLAIVSIGVTAGTVVATQTISQDLIIEAGSGEDGNLILNDGNLGVHTTPGANQLIAAKNNPGSNANFLVQGDGKSAVFSLRSTGAQAAVQFADDDTGQIYRMRIAQPDTDTFEIVDVTSGVSRMTIASNGDICIGAC